MLPELVENCDTLTIEKLKVKQELAEKKKELTSSPLYQEVMELEQKDKELEKLHKEKINEITDQMLEAGLKSFDTLDGRRLLLKKSPGRCVIQNEELIDDNYKVEKTTINIDKKSILKQLRAGGNVPGAEIDYSYKLQFSENK